MEFKYSNTLLLHYEYLCIDRKFKDTKIHRVYRIFKFIGYLSFPFLFHSLFSMPPKLYMYNYTSFISFNYEKRFCHYVAKWKETLNDKETLNVSEFEKDRYALKNKLDIRSFL